MKKPKKIPPPPPPENREILLEFASISGNLFFVTALLEFAATWADENNYTPPFVSNTSKGIEIWATRKTEEIIE